MAVLNGKVGVPVKAKVTGTNGGSKPTGLVVTPKDPDAPLTIVVTDDTFTVTSTAAATYALSLKAPGYADSVTDVSFAPLPGLVASQLVP